ncbi:hypothetical protein ACFPOU_08100 [Massilia jejuensis]|uniref:Helix-turn-helix protein n=1 Tax=Massilia jejuensis TaxID=648894 RepID=A0ABW0PHK5_9BURK
MLHYQLMAGRAVALARPLPLPLIEARAHVFHDLACLDLNQTARRVLFGILTFVRVNAPTKEIFPRRDTLRAEALLHSDSTLYRGLALLEQKGYITRAQSRKIRDGRFYLSPIHLTVKALVMLGLGDVIHSAPSTKVGDGHKEKELTKKSQSIQKTTGSPDSVKSNEIDRETRLPIELVPLLAQGVKRSAVCWLMAKAKAAGVRLGHVLQVVSGNIAALRGREVVGYLSSMLRKNVDFAWVAGQAREANAAARTNKVAQEKLATLDARYDGYSVWAEDGSLLGVFEAASSPCQLALIRSPNGSAPVNLRFARAWVDGKVRLAPSRHAPGGEGAGESDEW